LAGFLVVVFVVESVFVVDESVPVVDEEPVVDGVVLPVEDEEPEPIADESVDGVAGAGVVVGAGVAGVVVDVDVVDVDVLAGSVIVPDVFCVSGVFGGSLPPHATRPAKHAPTNRAETFMRNSRVGGTKTPRPFVFSLAGPARQTR